MSGAVSSATGRRYPLTMICAVFRVARSTVYRTMTPAISMPPVAVKRGPKTRWSDTEIVAAIRAVLAATPFHGEGYRKIRARLAHRGLAIGGKRVLRLMRVHHLLAPRRLGPPNGDPAHAGTITTTRPDEMWGTDATRFYTEAEGWCWFFGAIDHCVDELVGWHTAKIGDRWAALEPLRQGGAARVRPLCEGRRPRPADPMRLGSAVHRRCVDQRGEVGGDDDHAVVRRRAR